MLVKACGTMLCQLFLARRGSHFLQRPYHLSPGHGCLPHMHGHPELEIPERDTCDLRPKVYIQLCYCDWAPGVYTGTPRSAILHRYHGFYKLKVCSNPGLTKSAPFSNRVCLLCVYVSHFIVCEYFQLLHCYIMMVYDQ